MQVVNKLRDQGNGHVARQHQAHMKAVVERRDRHGPVVFAGRDDELWFLHGLSDFQCPAGF